MVSEALMKPAMQAAAQGRQALRCNASQQRAQDVPLAVRPARRSVLALVPLLAVSTFGKDAAACKSS